MDLAAPLEATLAPRLRLGGYMLELDTGELRGANGQLAPLRRQALDVLRVLGEQAGHVVSKDELMRRVWPAVVVGEDSLVQAIADIRRALGEAGHQLLRTVPRRGYMLMPDAAPGDVVTPAAQSWPWLPVLIVLALLAAVAAGFLLMPARDTLSVRDPLPATVSSRSLVVLPLEADAASADESWFADAVTGDLTSSLGRWPDLFTIGRGTAQRYKGKSVDPRDVARELGVRYVVRGTVRRDGDRVRLDMALVDGETGVMRWTQQYDIERAQLAQSLSDVRGGIARTLLIEMGRSVGERTARLKPEQVAADDLAMQGFGVLLRGMSAENFSEAGRLFEQAVAKDPESIRGLAGVSLANSMGVIFRWVPDPAAALRRSEQAQARLDSIDANGHMALVGRASLTNLRADWEGLLLIAGTLIEQYPSDATSHHHRCSALLRLGRFDDSIPSCERAIRISPRDSRVAVWHGLIGMNRFMQARYAQAAEHARQTVTANPKIEFYWLLLAASLAQDGRRDEAEQVVKDFRARFPNFVAAEIPTRWPARNPRFVEGRDRIVTTVRELGMP
jgi:TolB-like protein/DNA-binding winged helix-turn-helix (wHTH) protein